MGKTISKADLLSTVIKPIREAMANGDLLWLKGWDQGGGGGINFNPTRAPEKQGYKGGLNNLLLWIASSRNGWGDPRWMGFGQAKKKGWNVKRGQKSTRIYAPILGWRPDPDDSSRRISFVRDFKEVAVFNGQQIDGIPSLDRHRKYLDVSTGYAETLKVYERVGVDTNHGGSKAAYSPASDSIILPDRDRFIDAEEYHATRLHEIGHSTGHKSRLDRGLFSGGMKAYAEEELVADLFSAFMCSSLGVEKAGLTENHAAYIQSWHRRLGEDPNMLLRTINAAWKAYSYVMNL